MGETQMNQYWPWIDNWGLVILFIILLYMFEVFHNKKLNTEVLLMKKG